MTPIIHFEEALIQNLQHSCIQFYSKKHINYARLVCYIPYENIYTKKSFDAGFSNIQNNVWPAACCVNNETYSKLLLIFSLFYFRNDANSLLHSLLTPKNDGAQNGDLEVFRFSNISCDWAQCHYHGNGILYDASCKHVKTYKFIHPIKLFYYNNDVRYRIKTINISPSTHRNSTMP